MVLFALLSWNSINLFLCFTAFSSISVVTPVWFFFIFGSKPQKEQAPSGSAWQMILPQLRQLPRSGCSTAWQLHLMPTWLSFLRIKLFFYWFSNIKFAVFSKLFDQNCKIINNILCIKKMENCQMAKMYKIETHLVIVVIFRFPLCCSTTVGASAGGAAGAFGFFPFFLLAAPADQNSKSSSSSPFFDNMTTSSGICTDVRKWSDENLTKYWKMYKIDRVIIQKLCQ